MSDTFNADSGRGQAAVEKMKAQSHLIAGFGETFLNALSGAPKVLGHDEFGNNVARVISAQSLLYDQAVMALSQAADAVPHAVEKQMLAVNRAQQKVVDSIHDVNAGQGEGLPGKGGGVHGK